MLKKSGIFFSGNLEKCVAKTEINCVKMVAE